MKVVILAGGFGSRLSEETTLKPKPMVEIGGRPILWHIMKMYSAFGMNDFVICLGYKGYLIKEYFSNYFLHTSDITFDIANDQVQVHGNKAEPWKVTLIDTGDDTMTGGRLKRVRSFLTDATFCMTYGDGVADIDLGELLRFHNAHGKLATVTAVPPPARFGALSISGSSVSGFEEKPVGDGSLINGGFFVLSRQVLNYIEGDETVWEQDPMRHLVRKGQLAAFVHHGFWQPMDTLRDRNHLEALWRDGKAPWQAWS